MSKEGKSLIKENVVDIKSLIDEGLFEKALETITEYRIFINLAKESESVIDNYELAAMTGIEAQAQATIKAQEEVKAKKKAEAEAKAKEEADTIAKIRAEVRAEILAEYEAEEKARIEADKKTKDRAAAEAKKKKEDEAKFRAKVEAEERAKIKKEEEAKNKAKLKMPLFESDTNKPSSDYSSFFEKLEDDGPKKTKDKKGLIESAMDAGTSFIEKLSK